MIKDDNFSQFVHCAHLNGKKAANPPAELRLSELREVIADALDLPRREQERTRRLEHCPVPFDSTVCKSIAERLAQVGISLPSEAWKWPLPAGMSLTSSERLTIWREVLAHAREQGSIDRAMEESFRSVEPYIKPAGNGRWYLCNCSPVPFSLCARVFGTSQVTEKPTDNSIANNKRERSPEDSVFHEALVDQRKQKTEDAIKKFKRSADAGHANAAFSLAWLLEERREVSFDPAEVIRMYEIAAEGGVALAHHNLGGIYQAGEIVPQDIEKAIAHFEVAAQRGIAASLGCLGSIFLHGNSVEIDIDKARGFLIQGVAAGDDHSMNTLATLLDEENGFVSTRKTVGLYRRAARSAKQWNHALPFFNLALCYMNGNGVPKNLRTARRLFQIAANAGDSDAAFNLGYLHLHGLGTPTDFAEARVWIERAADKDNPHALNLLGMIYLKGKGVEVDYEHAVQLFRSAEELGSLDAVVNLAQCAVNGLGVVRDVPLALALLDEAEHRGHSSAAELRKQWFEERVGLPFPPTSLSADQQ
jgi:TPR repeat protein